MLKLIVGVKGTGKTKTLINLVNGALEVTKGDVVCIEKGSVLRFDIKPTARLINAEEYEIADAEALYGFVAGILSSNHDVTDLFIDGTFRLCNRDMDAFEKAALRLEKLVDRAGVHLTMTVSTPVETIPASLKKFM